MQEWEVSGMIRRPSALKLARDLLTILAPDLGREDNISEMVATLIEKSVENDEMRQRFERDARVLDLLEKGVWPKTGD